MEVVEAFPFAQFGFQIDVSFVAEKLVEFLPVRSVRSFHLAVELWRAAFDIGVADTQVLDVPVEFGLELMTVICPDLSDAERELVNGVIHEVDRVGLSVLFVNLQGPNTCRVVNCSVLETPNLLTPFLNEYQGLNIHLDVMA